jgi:hypothetical protein
MVYVKLSLSFFLFRIKTKTLLFAKCFKNYFKTCLQSSEASLLFLLKKMLQEKEMKKESDNKKRREGERSPITWPTYLHVVTLLSSSQRTAVHRPEPRTPPDG